MYKISRGAFQETGTAWIVPRPGYTLLPVGRHRSGVTDLRYLPDSDGVTEFEATVAEATDDYLVLDGTYFYPGGGGQPPDRGTLSWEGVGRPSSTPRRTTATCATTSGRWRVRSPTRGRP